MIGLNLLPPEEKTNIAREMILRRSITYGGFASFLIFIFLVILSSVWFSLFIQEQSLENIIRKNESSQENKSFLKFKEEINQLNLRLQNASKIESQTEKYSLLVEELASLVPSGIKFNELSFNKNQVALEGLAISRAELISFKEALEKSPNFEKIESPLSNLLKQNNIDFSFTFQIKSKN